VPRIQAPTVAEHRARQRRAILDAALAHLAEQETAPSLADVGARAGLARSSVYEYFSSRDDLLAEVVADVFPAWAARITEAVEAAPTPGQQVWAYVKANMELFAGAEQAVARALTTVVDPAVLAAPMTRFHESLQKPLLAALRAHGESQPEVMADIIGSMVVRASRDVWSPDKRTARRRLNAGLTLLHSLLDAYLRLTTDTPG
jgi:AcrR family transcriptional regulator